MIYVRKNPNFGSWFQIFSFGKMISEVRRQSHAMKIAEKEAKKNNQDAICFLDEEIKVKL